MIFDWARALINLSYFDYLKRLHDEHLYEASYATGNKTFCVFRQLEGAGQNLSHEYYILRANVIWIIIIIIKSVWFHASSATNQIDLLSLTYIMSLICIVAQAALWT